MLNKLFNRLSCILISDIYIYYGGNPFDSHEEFNSEIRFYGLLATKKNLLSLNNSHKYNNNNSLNISDFTSY